MSINTSWLRLRTTIVRALLVGLGLLFGILISEIGLRLSDLRSGAPPGMFVRHHRLGYRHAPNYEGQWSEAEFRMLVKTNSSAIRDRERKPKQKGTFRILALGDSFTWGYGVQYGERYTEVVEAILNRAQPRRFMSYEVINAAIPGWGTAQEFIYFLEHGQAWQPDMVLLGFADADIRENANFLALLGRPALRADGGETRERAPEQPSWRRVKQWLRTESRVWEIFTSRVVSLPALNDVLIETGLREVGSELYEKELRPDLVEGLRTTKLILSDLMITAGQKGIHLVVVLLPTDALVYHQRWLERRGLDPHRIRRELKRFAETEGIALIDPLPGMMALNDRKLFFPKDRHPTPAGHKILGEIIADALLRHESLSRQVSRIGAERY